jgi:signal transduction histidine kinase/CheY-like chemotaxis protein
MVHLEQQLERGSSLPTSGDVAADWSGEVDGLRRASLRRVGLVFVAAGYAWALGQAIAMQPNTVWSALTLPVSILALGLLLLFVHRPPFLRDLLLVGGALGVDATALFVQRSLYAPFVGILVVIATTIVGDPGLTFLAASLSTGLLLAARLTLPEQWQGSLLLAAAAFYWASALFAWLSSRDLRTVLTWALRSYESNWRTLRQLQAQRGKLNATLKALADANQLLKRTTHDLAEAREEAERARQLKSQFAANISHELRTPLHLIVGFSQMMYTSPESYRGVRWTPELRADLKEIYDSAQHLLHLIDDVLDLSQVEAARLPVNKERLDLVPLIHEAVATARSLFRGRGLYLRVDVPENLPALYADPTRIRQVLLNLLNNAARFTERGGITVHARLQDEEVEVVVEDTGIGIPPDQLQDIFTEFHQVDGSLRRRYGGTGLGLSICKQFVSLHDGRIWVESEVGKGSAFHFTLPLPSKQVVRAQPSQLPSGWHYLAPAPEGQRLVTLAQPAEFPRMLRRYLTDVDIREAEDAQKAAQLARTIQADAVILLDEQEAEAAEIARATADLLLPVITCSLPLERHLALAEGFTHCLMKPFTAEQLVATVKQVAPEARRILVVDDDPGVVRLIERSLTAHLPGLEVLTAYDGVAAIASLERQPDILLLDLLLPRANGLEVLRAVQNRQRQAADSQQGQGSKRGTIPVVAITAYGFEQDIAALGQGKVSLRRGRYYSATEVTQCLQALMRLLPARHFSADAEASPAPVQAPAG